MAEVLPRASAFIVPSIIGYGQQQIGTMQSEVTADFGENILETDIDTRPSTFGQVKQGIGSSRS